MTSNLVTDDPSHLEDFERRVPVAPLRALAWSIEKYEVAQLLALSRLTLDDVSRETKVPISAIKRWKQHPDFQQYTNEIVLQSAETLKAKRLMVLSKILDARLEAAEVSGSYGTLSMKDTVDIMGEMRKETEGDGAEDKSQYVKIVEALLKRTKANEVTPSASPAELLTQGTRK